ncbi:MAG: hypothetical protein JXR07_13180 [Reichenbachiella sp.]
MDKKFFLALSFWIMSLCLSAQKIESTGTFEKDSVKIGEAVNYTLTVKYPAEWQVIFPDSTFDYLPFEYYSKTYFPSAQDSVYVIDSVVYSLATFEIDQIQKLAVPIFILNKGDSIEVLPETDSVFLLEMISKVPDTLAFRSNVKYLPVQYALNYPYISIGLLIFIVVCVLIMVFYGKKIAAKIKLYRMKKDFEKFSLEFEQGINNIRQNERNQELIEEIIVIWKQYMERIENKPFTKYTSKEILLAGYENSLVDVLKNIDRSIYGNVSDDQMHKNFESLEDMTLQRYQLKIKEVLNG